MSWIKISKYTRGFNRCVVSEHAYEYKYASVFSGFRSHSVYWEMDESQP